jgi:hypothetical protein
MIKPPFPPISPLPPIDPHKLIETIKNVVNVGKKLYQIIKGALEEDNAQTSKEVGEVRALKEDQLEITDVSELSRILANYLERIQAKADSMERDMLSECSYFFDELLDLMKDYQEQLAFYQISVPRVERDLERAKISIQGSLKSEISRQISLDNPECRSILRMPPGNKKEQRMLLFTEEVIAKGFEGIISKIKETLTVLADELQLQIEEGMHKVEAKIEHQLEILEQLENESEDNKDKVREIKGRAINLQNLCDYGLAELSEERR